MPTLLERSGDFSQSVDALGRPIQIIDPVDRASIFERRDSRGPAQSAGAVAPAVLPDSPTSTLADATTIRHRCSSAPIRTARRRALTQSINGRNQLFGNVSYQRTTTDAANVFGFTDSTHLSTLDAAINWSHRFSQFLSRAIPLSVHPPVHGRDAVLRRPHERVGRRGHRRQQSGAGELGAAGADVLRAASPVWQRAVCRQRHLDARRWASKSSKTIRPPHPHHRRRHSAATRDVLSQQDARGTFSFTGAATGSDLADFLLGIPATSSIAFGNADKGLRASNADAYINDDWRVTPTLDGERRRPLGIRIAVHRSAGSSREPRRRRRFHGRRAGGRRRWRRRDDRAALSRRRCCDRIGGGVQPRFGVAWRPVAGSSLVVRAGYGIYRNTNVYQSMALLLAQQPPFSKTLSVENSADTADAGEWLFRGDRRDLEHVRDRSGFPRRLRAQLAAVAAARSARRR